MSRDMLARVLNINPTHRTTCIGWLEWQIDAPCTRQVSPDDRRKAQQELDRLAELSNARGIEVHETVHLRHLLLCKQHRHGVLSQSERLCRKWEGALVEANMTPELEVLFLENLNVTLSAQLRAATQGNESMGQRAHSTPTQIRHRSSETRSSSTSSTSEEPPHTPVDTEPSQSRPPSPSPERQQLTTRNIARLLVSNDVGGEEPPAENCPICDEPMLSRDESGQPVLHVECLDECHRRFHEHCTRRWAYTRSHENLPVNGPLCRDVWWNWD